MARSHYHRPDTVLIGLMFFLIAFGLVMLSSAGAVVGFQKFGSSTYFVARQLLNFVVGFIAFFFMYRIDYHVWKKHAVLLLAVSIGLLVVLFFPGVGFAVNGAKRWINLGGFLLQPAEVVKMTFLIYLAVWLEKRGKGIRDFSYGLLPFGALLGVIVLLVMLQPDMGTVSIIFFVSLVVYFVAGAPWRHFFAFFAAAGALFLVLIKIAPYRLARLTVFLNPSHDPQGAGYHINQALLAIGSGGLFGLGLGHSRQKYNFLPEVTGDSIFAIIAEELGFIMVTALIILFLYFLYRGLAIARRAPDVYGKYLAVGISVGIVLQALVNIAALSALLPLTGITLPFISSGGSSLVISMASVGLLANISRQTKE